MNDIVNKYPLDLTGTSPENLLLGEPHTLHPGLNRAAVPRYGAFYTESLVVRDGISGALLVPNDQYIPIMYYAEPSERSGKEICTAVIVTDGSVSDEVTLDYQVVGGDYANITQVIIDLIDNLNLDDREVIWGDLLGRPDAFPPSPHLHDLGDIYGFEYVVQQLDQIRQAILYGDVASHDEIRIQIEDRYQLALTRAEEVRTQLESHSDRTDNPHQVTQTQVGLSQVSNYRDATQLEAEEGLNNSRFMTPNRVRQAIASQVGVDLSAHTARSDNPHLVTKAQVGLGNLSNNLDATPAEAIEGVRSDRYITPPSLVAAIDQLAGDAVAAHDANKDNPHLVTKTQVGLGSVANHPLGSLLDAQEGTRNDRYMTPQRVKEAIAFQAGLPLTAHVSNTSNPHQVTKAQVGLGSVSNFPVASSLEALTGTASDRYMTPALVSSYVTETLTGTLARYVQKNVNESLSLRESAGTLQAYVAGTWRQVWPPQWQ